LLASIGLTPIPGVSTTPRAVAQDPARELSTHATAAHPHPHSSLLWQHYYTASDAMQVLTTPSCTRGGCVRAVSPPRTRAAPPELRQGRTPRWLRLVRHV